ncbi:deacylase [Kordiimonas sediminis]|uniref:Deacylase n=1 Tax=Kordiimonas sediminis TaxID=1735581 RepID=A0A919AKG8_9PROT|nr:succinylglutamate desuccinylase/aspartoacylase family protein [Kordiimonas sediminis]GHF11907.1 deacylase [Kordiimonas sediminis]
MGSCIKVILITCAITLVQMVAAPAYGYVTETDCDAHVSGGSADGSDEGALDNADACDRVDGVPVITALDTRALALGTHYFYYRAGEQGTGNPIFVPIIVVKGASEGPRLVLTAAVHGDELNGIGVIHQLIRSLETETILGTLIALPGINQTGMVASSRHFQMAAGGGAMVDLNRIMPGSRRHGSMAERYVWGLWHNILKDNADLAIDLHTQTRGTAYPLFVFADFRKPVVWQMAKDLMPDIIKRDKGQKGALETTFVKEGIPAVTFEVGAPKQFQERLIDRAVAGIRNVMVRHEMLVGTVTKPLLPPVIGSNYTNVTAQKGGVVSLHVRLLDPVKKGQHIATMADPFGRELQRYYAPHDGHVLAIATDPLREAGTMLVRILH